LSERRSVDPVRLGERIREHARTLGFQQVGFAPADRPTHADDYLGWIDRGWHGEMDYMAREDSVRRRLSPGEALTGCRSLIVVALRYSGPVPASADPPSVDPLRAIVAGYAAGPDYHGVFEERLARLATFVEHLVPDADTKPYVDYGPVLERDHAQRAGLGWIGKNTMLIDPKSGSYLLLGELLTTVQLPPDPPFTADRCGTCDRCIPACPTGAIRSPRTLDARLCISYLTIELRGPIPEHLRPLIGNRVFGCDICQEVCPWNRGISEPADSPLGARPGEPVAPATMIGWAEELLSMDDEGCRARYRGTAFHRPGRAGMLRNLCVGLGNSGRPEALPVLQRAAADDSELVREHARWAMDRLEAG